MLPKIVIVTILLLGVACKASPLTRHHRHHHIQNHEIIKSSDENLTPEEIDQKLSSLRHYKHDLIKYRRILENLNEILTDYDDNEYTDLEEMVHFEDLIKLLKHLHKVEEEMNVNNKKHDLQEDVDVKSKKKHKNINKFIDYNETHVPNDVPASETDPIEDIVKLLQHLHHLEDESIESKKSNEKSLDPSGTEGDVSISKTYPTEDIAKLLQHLHHLEDESIKPTKKENKFVDYDPSEMLGDMPIHNSLDSYEANRRKTIERLPAEILQTFNLTREQLFALMARMQGSASPGAGAGSRGLMQDQGLPGLPGGPQQDQDARTMSPQELREVYNLTVNGDGKVVYDRVLDDDEHSMRARQLAIQQIKKNILTHFHNTRMNESNARSTPALLRRPMSPRHAQESGVAPAIDEAHRAFLMHAEQYQRNIQQQQDEPESNAGDINDDGFRSQFTEKNVAYHPKCELPRNTDAESWSDGSNINLLFDVSSTVRSDRPNLTVESAVLRVYKLAPNSTETQRSSEADEQVRISVSWYTRSLKKHRVKRKISDSKMVPVGFSGWIELNLKGAVVSWKNGRNHGVSITVEDQEGLPLRAETYVEKQDCSNTHPRPFPWVLYKQKAIPSDILDIPRLPRLDLSTRESVSYNYQVLPNLVNSVQGEILREAGSDLARQVLDDADTDGAALARGRRDGSERTEDESGETESNELSL